MNKSLIPLDEIHLAAIPLSDRNNRRLLRDILEQYHDELEKARIEFDPELPMDDYLLKVKAVQIAHLRELEAIDALPDGQYVDALVKFKKSVVAAYHAQAVNEGKTKDNVYKFCLEFFHEEFSVVGRAEAEREINSQESDHSSDAMSSMFVVAFDGTVVENKTPIIGAESPFAIITMRQLQERGHKVILWHDREEVHYRDMMTFLNMGGFTPNGTIKKLPVLSLIVNDIVDGHDLELIEGQVEIPVDYIVHNSSFQCARMAVTGDENNVSFYWGDLVNDLVVGGYLSEENKNTILNHLATMME